MPATYCSGGAERYLAAFLDRTVKLTRSTCAGATTTVLAFLPTPNGTMIELPWRKTEYVDIADNEEVGLLFESAPRF